MYIAKTGNNSTGFNGLRKVVSTVLTTKNDWKAVRTYAEKSCPTFINFDVFTSSKKVKQPLYKKVIQLISGKDKIVGTHNTFPDGSYDGVRIYKDGTRFDYSTFKYKTEFLGDKLGVNLTVTQKDGQKYNLQFDEAYRHDGKINIPTLKSIKDANKRALELFETRHAKEIKNLGYGY